MNLKEFRNSIRNNTLPATLSQPLQALWYDGSGNWEKAHELVQDEEGPDAAWIHAYLHRREGDTWNADYWYRRAGRQRPAISLENEWELMVEALLAEG